MIKDVQGKNGTKAITDLDARHRASLPTLIAGDFNAAPDAASIRYLTGRQSIAGRSVHCHDAWETAARAAADACQLPAGTA